MTTAATAYAGRIGTSVELVSAATILLAQVKGIPVSTTHILSSGVPATMGLAGLLYWLFLTLIRATEV